MRREMLVGPRGIRFEAEVPLTRLERKRGLLGRPRLPPGEALLLEGTRSVHTFGMCFPITVAFLDDDLRVVRMARMCPGRLALPRPGARHALELCDGTDIRVGDRLVRDGRREEDPAAEGLG